MKNLFDFVKLTIILMIVSVMVSLVFSCATAKKIVRNINDIATDYCVYVLNADSVQPDGISIEDICRIQRNVDYFIDILLREKAGAYDVDQVLENGITDNTTEETVIPDPTGQGENLSASRYNANTTDISFTVNSEATHKKQRTGQGVM